MLKAENSVAALLFELEAAGVHVGTDGGSVFLEPPGVVHRELQARLITAKRDILELAARRTAGDLGPRPESPVPHVPHAERAQHSSEGARAARHSCNVSGGRTCVTCAAAAELEQTPATGDPKPLTPIIVHFETRAPVAIEQVGARAHVRHPAMHVLCASFLLPNSTFVNWVPGDPPPEQVFDLISQGVPVVSDDADRIYHLIWKRLEWPNVNWVESVSLARVRGLGGSLAGVAADLLGIRTFSASRAVVLDLGGVGRTGQFADVSPPKRAALNTQSRMNVLLVRKLWDATLSKAAFVEPDVRDLDAVINERGFAFDAELARAIIHCESRLADAARHQAGVHSSVLASNWKLRKELAAAGCALPDVQRNRLLDLLNNPDLPDDARALVIARLASSGITTYKLRAALRRVDPDGRLRDTLVYHRAHTGRWAGRGFQPQNLPRGAKLGAEAVDGAIHAVLRRDVEMLHELATAARASAHDVCASLVRACVHAPAGRLLAIVDYGQIEARALHWLAGDSDALAPFRNRDGVDPYVAMAARLFQIDVTDVDNETQRPLGKALVLGCGYQMGAPRFESYAAEYGIDWSRVGITPGAAVDGWRRAHPAVAAHGTGLWYRIEDAALRAASGSRTELGPLAWERQGQDVVCTLPSRRPLVYRRARVEACVTRWGKRPTFTYERHGQRVESYAGRLTENVVQAFCRDLLADALVRLERAEKFTVLHVHDEIIAEIDDPSEVHEIESIMCRVPIWAAGLPLKAIGHCGRRYRK